MAFPTNLDVLTNPSNTDKLNNPPHATQHAVANDAIEAIEAKLGTGTSTPTANKVLRATGIGTTAYGQVDLSTDVATFSSANLRAALTDETGTGSAVFATSPTITTPTIASFTNATHDHTNAAGGGTLGTGAVSVPGTLATGVVTSPKQSTELQKGWEDSYGGTQFPAPSTVTYKGNHSYSLVFNSVDLTGAVSSGMRLRVTRSVAAPTRCADLEAGSSQYFSKTSPNKLTFTDDHTEMGWIKLESYAAGGIIARRNADTEGWSLSVNASGQLLAGSYRVASNNSVTTSSQSLPLDKWVHVAATTDLSGTSVILYIDGVVVPSTTVITGTITALVQGTTALVVGAEKSAGTNPFDGKIAQIAVFDAVLSAATIRSYISQGLIGTETNLKSAYSFDSSITDLNITTPNDLTAQGSAVATSPDSPFCAQANDDISSTLEYGIIMDATFSTNTTLVVQAPEGGAIPTSGGVSAMSYSGQKAPYQFPCQIGKWVVETVVKANVTQASPVSGTWYNLGSTNITIPIGLWNIGYLNTLSITSVSATANISASMSETLSTLNNGESDSLITSYIGSTGYASAASTVTTSNTTKERPYKFSSQTVLYLNAKANEASNVSINFVGASSPILIYAENAYA